jgi:hypothetical protein
LPPRDCHAVIVANKKRSASANLNFCKEQFEVPVSTPIRDDDPMQRSICAGIDGAARNQT